MVPHGGYTVTNSPTRYAYPAPSHDIRSSRGAIFALKMANLGGCEISIARIFRISFFKRVCRANIFSLAERALERVPYGVLHPSNMRVCVACLVYRVLSARVHGVLTLLLCGSDLCAFCRLADFVSSMIK